MITLRKFLSVLLCLALVWPEPLHARRRWVPTIAGGGGGGGIALVASAATAGNTTTATTAGINTTGANLLVAVVASYASSAAPTVSDSKGNTWSSLTAQVSGDNRCQIFYSVPSSVGSAHTFSTSSVAASYASICAASFSDASATPFDVQNGAGGMGITTLATGSVTPSVNGSLVIAGLSVDVNSTVTVDGSLTIADQVAYGAGNNFGAVLAYYTQPTAGAINPTFSWTGAAGAAARITTFKP